MAKKKFSLQQELRFDELFLNNVFDAIQDGITVLTPDFTISYTNSVIEKLFQDKSPLKGKKCYNVFHNRKSICPWCPSIKTLKSGDKCIEEVPIGSEKSPKGWLELTSYPLFDEDEGIVGVIEHIKDITEWIKAKNELIKERDLFSEGPVLTIIWSPKKNLPVKYVSKNISEVLGYTPEEWLYNDFNYTDIIHPDDRDYVMKEVNTNLKNHREVFSQEYRIKKKNGSYISIYAFSKYERNDKGNVVEIRGYIFDQTERKLAEAIEKTLYNIAHEVNRCDDMVELYDQIRTYLGVIIDTSNFFIGLYDEKNDELAIPYNIDEKNEFNKLANFTVKEEGIPSIPLKRTMTAHVIRNGKSLLATKDELDEMQKSGIVEGIGTLPEIWLGVPLKTKDTVIGAIVVQNYKDPHTFTKREENILQYVSDQIALLIQKKHADNAVRASEKKYRTIVTSMSDIIFMISKDLRFEEVHCKPETILLMHPDEFIGKKINKVLPKDIVKEYEKLAKKTRSTKKTHTMEYSLKINGKDRWFRGILNICSDCESIIFDVRDITKRKKAEQIQLTMYKISHAVNTVENIHELYVKIREYIGCVIDTRNFYVVLYDEATDTISLPFEVDEKDQYETFPAGRTLTSYVVKTGKPLFASKDVQNKLVEKGYIEIIGAPAKLWLGIPLKSDGQVIGALVVQSYDDPNLYSEEDIDILTFISEEIVLAIQHAQAHEQLQHDLREKRVLLKEIQHRVKNNLQTISGLLQLQQYRIETKEDAIKGFEVSQDRIQAMAKAYEILLESEYLSDVGIGKYIKSLTVQLKRNYDVYNKIDIEYLIEEVIIDTERLGKIGLVINEIITNSMKYAFRDREEGTIKIHLKDNNESIKISISDDGVGIPKEVPFPNPDTLGLSLVEMLVNELEGEITLIQEAGTTYDMVIPKEKHW